MMSPRLRALFEQAGARFVDVPVLHPADPFLETAGEDIRRRMFVTEGPSGERLALRPDFTIPVCLAHLRRGDGPARYAYQGLVFRRQESGARERLEAGYEDIGGADLIAADSEAVALAVAAAGEAHGPGLVVRLGDIGLFTALLAALGLPEPWRRRLRRSFGASARMAAHIARLAAHRPPNSSRLDPAIATAAETHDRARLVVLIDARLAAHGHAPGTGRLAEEIATRFLDQRALAEAAVPDAALDTLAAYLRLAAPLGEAAMMLAAFAAERGVDFSEVLGAFVARAEAIRQRAPAARLDFEAGFGRPLDYYTGLVFDIRTAGGGEPLAGGGRYDRLMQMLGATAPVPAVGFALSLDAAEGGP